MPNYTIAEEPLNLEYLKELYELNRGRYHDFSYANLNCIFDIACHNPSMFPTINVQEVSDCVPYIYMGKWFDRYFDALMNIPSLIPQTSRGKGFRGISGCSKC